MIVACYFEVIEVIQFLDKDTELTYDRVKFEQGWNYYVVLSKWLISFLNFDYIFNIENLAE